MFNSIKMTSKPINMIKVCPSNLSARKGHSDCRFKGKVAIITASTEGIGYAIAQKLGSEGASVVISSRKANNVENAVKNLRSEGIQVEGIVCHVGKAEQRKKLFDIAKTKFGGLDILVSNAAVNPAVSPILETDEAVWDKIFEINVKCSWLLAKEAYPELAKRGGGSIVFISSIAGYQPMEITSSEAGKEQSLSIVPMKRFGKPSEIANTVAFLASDEASYITGETIVTAGGAYAHL